MSQGLPPTGSAQATPSSGMAIASMVLGIISLVLICVWWVAIPCAVIAAILGFVARGKVKGGTGAGGGMAMAGIVCGIVSIALSILVVVGALAFLGLGGAKVMEDMQKEIQKQQQQGVPGPQGMLLTPYITYVLACLA